MFACGSEPANRRNATPMSYAPRFEALENEEGGTPPFIYPKAGTRVPSVVLSAIWLFLEEGEQAYAELQRSQIPTVGLHAHLSCSTRSKQGTAEEIWNRIITFLIKSNTKRKTNVKCTGKLSLTFTSVNFPKSFAKAAQVENVPV